MTVNNIIQQAIFLLKSGFTGLIILGLVILLSKSIIPGSFEVGGIALGLAHGVSHGITINVNKQCTSNKGKKHNDSGCIVKEMGLN